MHKHFLSVNIKKFRRFTNVKEHTFTLVGHKVITT